MLPLKERKKFLEIPKEHFLDKIFKEKGQNKLFKNQGDEFLFKLVSYNNIQELKGESQINHQIYKNFDQLTPNI
jgi:hypothetical protein